MTAYALKEDRSKFLDLGFTEYISKPINTELMIDTINYVLVN